MFDISGGRQGPERYIVRAVRGEGGRALADVVGLFWGEAYGVTIAVGDTIYLIDESLGV